MSEENESDFEKNWNDATRRYTVVRKPTDIASDGVKSGDVSAVPSSVDFLTQSEISLDVDQSCNDFNEFQEQENLVDTSSDQRLEPLTVESTNQRFQSISIGNEVTVGMRRDKFKKVADRLFKLLKLRHDYMRASRQKVNSTHDRHVSLGTGQKSQKRSKKSSISVDAPYHPPATKNSPYADLKADELPNRLNWTWGMKEGVFELHELGQPVADIEVPSTEKFIESYRLLLHEINNGNIRSYCWRRLQLLTHKFHLHFLLNANLETNIQKELPHRDFYNCRKVDNHIHAAACMNQKHLLRFIKRTIREDADTVCRTVNGTPQTLREMFNEIGVSAYDLSVDLLDVRAGSEVYHRFDKFNSKYSPLGNPVLREIYIKTNNETNGKYFASIIKEVADDLEESKYQHAELRLSIYGRRYDEFEQLAKWAVTNNVNSEHMTWLIQVPRLFSAFRGTTVKTFQDFLRNVFGPIMDASLHPKRHPELARFLEDVVGFDSVDDESKPDSFEMSSETEMPDAYERAENPPYAYYIWFMYANISMINQVRQRRGLNTFTLRPHCGEAGRTNHLAVAFLLAENINHGINLRKSPVMEYLYYLTQIGISMSPMSNNALFLPYSKSPFREFFERGQHITLSTDDPLQFHMTREPLMEEYSVAAQVWKLSSVDLAEIAVNSVIMSGFKHELKQYWLGPLYQTEGEAGNDIRRTNVPDVRVRYRHETLDAELALITTEIMNSVNTADNTTTKNTTTNATC